MKTNIVWFLLLWFGFVCEQSRPDLFPSGSLLLSLAATCLFWCQTATGVCLSGFFLLARWVLFGTVFPAEIFTVLFLSMAFLTHARHEDAYRHRQNSWWPVAAIAAVSQLILAGLPVILNDLPLELVHLALRLVAASAIVAAVAIIDRLADDFGYRRTTIL